MSKTPTTDLIFVDQPPTKAGRLADPNHPIRLWLDALRQHPGQWAKYPDPQPTRTACGTIKNGKAYGAQPGEFEAKTSAAGATNGRVFIYARYVGEVDA